MIALFTALLLSAQAQTIRVGVFGLFRPAELTVKPLPGTILEIKVDGETFHLEGSQAAGLRAWNDDVDCFLQRRSVPSKSVRVSARGGGPASLTLAVPGRISRRFDGVLDVAGRAGVLQAVVSMDVEDAVASAVAAESAPDTALEALKAQAVVTRSYYAATRARHEGFDFCDTTHCQFLKEPAAGLPAEAAAQTRGLLIRYEGRTVAALFHQSCGGRTRTAAEVGLASADYPYFAVDCATCRREAKAWTVRLQPDEARPFLKGPNEQARLAIGRRLGWSAFPSNNFTLRREEGAVVVEGRGAGHGVGLCQLGAAGMARSGASFQEILARYLPGTVITR